MHSRVGLIECREIRQFEQCAVRLHCTQADLTSCFFCEPGEPPQQVIEYAKNVVSLNGEEIEKNSTQTRRGKIS
ncbi:MAG: hypothetical protein D3910_03625 [Candidatus Electrothrix sp. ATG2]|nr:hypothetical protein [Candidatus Electrothrix sp. ATG2]